MARPGGVAVVSERLWAFAGVDGTLREGAVPAPRDRRRRGAPPRRDLARCRATDALRGEVRHELRSPCVPDRACAPARLALRADRLRVGRRRHSLARADDGALARRRSLDQVLRPRLPPPRTRPAANHDEGAASRRNPRRAPRRRVGPLERTRAVTTRGLSPPRPTRRSPETSTLLASPSSASRRSSTD